MCEREVPKICQKSRFRYVSLCAETSAGPADARGRRRFTMPTTSRDHAVVFGASLAGLLAARVLADEYATVTIVERDQLPTGNEHRRGVPHGHHVHGVLPLGGRLIEQMLPGITDELSAAGAWRGDILGNVRWILHGRKLRQAHTGLPALSASRPLIEGTIRRRVLSLPNVTLLSGYDIVGVGASPDRSRITSARVSSVDGQGSRILPADLVVDATGRGSRTPRWLTDLGYAAPQQDRVQIDLAYSTIMFADPHEALGDDIVVTTVRFPGVGRSGVMQRLEGGRILVTLIGIVGERPPADLPGFIEYARTLAAPDTYEVARAGKPLGEAVTFRLPTYVRQRYEQLSDLPAGLLVTGDAVCSFNPVYAQGISVAAADAVALRDAVSQPGDPDPTRYFAAVSKALDAPWGIAVGSDMAMPGVTGPAMPASPLTPDYLRSLQLGAADDVELATALIRVNAMIDPPAALLRPEIVERVRQLQGAVA
jgi:2-polyprenyl-6-methoxyphenol hydroxylase-like FAD-dependent oxidoreductase